MDAVSELGRLIGEVPDFRHLTEQERDEAVERFMAEAARIRAAQSYPWALRVERHEDGGFMRPREDWGEGLWQREPDLVEWRHESGLALLMNRSSTGAWCGYVGLPPPHRYYARHYGKIEENASHQGLTFADYGGGHISHTPRDGESREVWWIGFDCAHAWDLAPAMEALTRSVMPEFTGYLREGRMDVYRDLDYVRANVEDLAAEMAAGAAPGSLGRERWWWWHVAMAKQFFLQDLPEMWRTIYLEQDRLGRYFWREGK